MSSQERKLFQTQLALLLSGDEHYKYFTQKMDRSQEIVARKLDFV